ncbi:hypothetical protein MNNICLKF_01968 [Synechococcus sp. CBW1107]|nr:hypothetical protein MNNICLKF_01968 [Synechococcus sp. CBW1107]
MRSFCRVESRKPVEAQSMPSGLFALDLASVIRANRQSANQATTLSVAYVPSPAKKRGVGCCNL